MTEGLKDIRQLQKEHVNIAEIESNRRQKSFDNSSNNNSSENEEKKESDNDPNGFFHINKFERMIDRYAGLYNNSSLVPSESEND